MSLGDLLFHKNNNKKNTKHTQAKASIDKIEIAEKNKYAVRKKFISQDFRKLKTVKIAGEYLTKQSFADLLSGISKRLDRDVTYQDFQRYLRKSYHTISYQDKKKLLTWAKKYSEKQLKTMIKTQQPIDSTPNKVKKKANIIDARDVIAKQKFVSPKQQAQRSQYGLQSLGNRLGIKNMSTGFQRGHAVNPQSMGMEKSNRSVDTAKRLVVSGGASVSRKSSKGISTAGIKLKK